MTPEGPGEAERVEVTVGAVAHGGHCVARLDGRVVFVRHALPGERVVAEITEVHRDFLRADAVRVLTAAPDRVTPPCRYAGADLCGGCDLQHVSASGQRDWKAAVVREQLARLGGLSPAEVDTLAVRVEHLPGGPLGWRSRMRYAVDAAGRAGLLKHRSHEVVPIDRCLIAHPAIRRPAPLASRWPAADAVEALATSTGDVVAYPRIAGAPAARPVAIDPTGPTRSADLGRSADAAGPAVLARGGLVRERAAGREWELPAEAFWQVHPAAADTLVTTVLDLLGPRPGETGWDLYGGAGLFAAALAERVGPGGRVTLVESAPAGVAAARDNLRDLPTVEVVAARVETALARRRVAGPVDLVVVDPPRTGLGRRVVRDLLGCGARAICYVACDPAAFGRDVREFRAAGWRLDRLRVFDLFPMTQHVECVGLLTPPR
nr:TRAM domain-containing protein [Micromonospora sp. DSM 115978]